MDSAPFESGMKSPWLCAAIRGADPEAVPEFAVFEAAGIEI